MVCFFIDFDGRDGVCWFIIFELGVSIHYYGWDVAVYDRVC